MYDEHGVLADVLEQARKELGENLKNLPATPPKGGSLDIFKK
jgi:hypothetical protein